MPETPFTVTRPKTLGDLIARVIDPEFSHERATALNTGAAATFEIGQVMGRQMAGAITVERTNVAGAGKGALTLATPPNSAAVKTGVYRVVFIEPAADSGSFVVEDPEGVVVGNGVVGTAFDGPVKFTIADGSTDFVAGDTALVTVSVAAGSGKIVPLNTSATDGSQVADCVLGQRVTLAATTGEDSVLAVTRLAILRASQVVWPAGISAANRATATAQLAAKHILIRDDV